MKKKEGEGKNWKKILLGTASKILKDKLEDFAVNIKERIQHTMKVIAERIFSSILMIIAFIFLVIAFTFYLIEYQGFTKTISFLIAAGVLFLLSFIIRYHSKR